MGPEPEPAEPNPTPCSTLAEARVDSEQRAFCHHRPACLGVAAKAGWSGFSCAGCRAFTPTIHTERREEIILLALLGELLGDVEDQEEREVEEPVERPRRGRQPGRAPVTPDDVIAVLVQTPGASAWQVAHRLGLGERPRQLLRRLEREGQIRRERTGPASADRWYVASEEQAP